MGAGALGAVAIHHRLGRWSAALAVSGEVAEQCGRDHRVAAGGRADLGGTNDLRVGVDRQVALVAVEAMGGGLVAMTGLGIDSGDDPVGRGALEAPEAPVGGLLDVWPVTVANSVAASATLGPSRSPRRA